MTSPTAPIPEAALLVSTVACIAKAVSERSASRRSESVERLCWGAPDGCTGVIVDAFGPLLVCTVYAPQSAEAFASWEDALRKVTAIGACGGAWLLKMRILGQDGYRIARSDGLGDTSVFEATEDGLRFEIGCDARHDFGVFPDAHQARKIVRAEANGRTVLNLFSYTCGFGLAALQGGAASVCNVDASREYLAWGKRNSALNGMDFRVIPETAQAFLRRSLRRKETRGHGEFDFIVADPPAFGVGRDNDRLLRLFWPEMARLLVALAPEKMVLLFNDKYFRERKAASAFVKAQFDASYDATWIPARPGDKAEGQANGDPFYLPPHIVLLKRRDVP